MTASGRVLYVASGTPGGTSEHRRWALERLGYQVDAVDSDAAIPTASRIGTWLTVRTQRGATVRKFNSDLIGKAERGRYDIAWFDKAVFVDPQTLSQFAAAGIRTVHYNPDNPFGPRRDPGWGMFLKALPSYDVHVVPRECNLEEYVEAGAKRVLLMPFSYEPSIFYPPPDGWSDTERKIDVGFVGSPYDSRGAFIEALWRDHGVATAIRGSRWNNVLGNDMRQQLRPEGPVLNDAYRETIWRSKIMLGFVTQSNGDSYARRCFEIAACGGFMIAQRAPGSLACFEEDREAVYFDDVADCAQKIRRYLDDEQGRNRIGRAARERSLSSGYDNDSRLRRVLDEATA